MTDARERTIVIALATIFCAAGALISFFVAGATLGFFIGGVGFATLIVPTFALMQSRRRDCLFVICASSFAVALVWQIALHSFAPIVILFCYLATLCGIGRVLVCLRTPAQIANAIVVAVAFAWLSWPMWLTSSSQRTVANLVAIHPLFNLNALAPNLGIWTQQPILYRLTTLGQDVPYALPRSVWPCTIAHAAVGLIILFPSRARR